MAPEPSLSLCYFPRANSVRLPWPLRLIWGSSLRLESSSSLSTSLHFKELLKSLFSWELYYADFPINCIPQASFSCVLSWPNPSASTLGETHYFHFFQSTVFGSKNNIPHRNNNPELSIGTHHPSYGHYAKIAFIVPSGISFKFSRSSRAKISLEGEQEGEKFLIIKG